MRVLRLVAALLVVLVVRLLRPVFLVRFGVLVSGRIGHLVGNTEVWLAERQRLEQPRGWLGGVELWCHSGRACNEQVGRMVDRALLMVPQLLWVVNRALRGWERHVCESAQHDRDIHDALERTRPHLAFSEEELRWGEHGLRLMGIPAGGRWVCLIVRDGAYLDSPRFEYHKYRDSNIANYERAALALARRGYWVVRMGQAVRERFECAHPHVIDYATNGMRTDFMDVYLAAHCEFAVSTGTGLDAICVAFRRPVCYVNAVPLEYLFTWVHGLAIWKRHFRGGLEMTPAEIFSSGAGQFLRAQDFEEAGITLVENTPEEIETAVIEMDDYLRYARMWPSSDQEFWNQEFWKQFPVAAVSTYNGKHIHGKIRLRIGREFLRSYDRATA